MFLQASEDSLPSNFFPEGIIWAEGKESDLALLPKEEQVYAAHLGVGRKKEFILGRTIVRKLLASDGFGDFPLLPGPDGAPLWPEERVGCITHCKGYAIAVYGKKSSFPGLGIDLERVDRLKPPVFGRVLTRNEKAIVEKASPEHQQSLATAFFSAKEAFYKYQHPLTSRWVGFLEVELSLDYQKKQFQLASVPASVAGLLPAPLAQGHFAYFGDFCFVGFW